MSRTKTETKTDRLYLSFNLNDIKQATVYNKLKDLKHGRSDYVIDILFKHLMEEKLYNLMATLPEDNISQIFSFTSDNTSGVEVTKKKNKPVKTQTNNSSAVDDDILTLIKKNKAKIFSSI